MTLENEKKEKKRKIIFPVFSFTIFSFTVPVTHIPLRKDAKRLGSGEKTRWRFESDWKAFGYFLLLL